MSRSSSASECRGLNGRKASDWLRLCPPGCVRLGGWCSVNALQLHERFPLEPYKLHMSTCLEPYGSPVHPNWRESKAQLTEKQTVLLMHDTLPQGIKSVRALLQRTVFTDEHV